MALKLKGSAPRPGEADRRYYMIDVQVHGRRIRLSTGTKDRELALKNEQFVVDTLRVSPNTPESVLREGLRGSLVAAKIAKRRGVGLTLREAFERGYRDPRVWGDIKRQDAIQYKQVILERIFGADCPLAAINQDAVDDAMLRLLKGEGGHPERKARPRDNATVNRTLSVLVSLIRTAREVWREESVREVPILPHLDERGGREFILDIEQEKKVLDAVLAIDKKPDSEKGGRKRKRDAYRYHGLYIVLLDTGMRHGEALGMAHENVDLKRREIRLDRRERLKTESSRRAIPMTERVFEVLSSDACRSVKGGPFRDLNQNRSRYYWSEALKDVGIKDRDAVIHALRHTNGTRLLSAVGDVRLAQVWLGHSDIKTTQRYAKVVDERMREASKRLELMTRGVAPPQA